MRFGSLRFSSLNGSPSSIAIAQTNVVKASERAIVREDSVKRQLDGKPPRRIIVVPGRIVNVVAG